MSKPTSPPPKVQYDLQGHVTNFNEIIMWAGVRNSNLFTIFSHATGTDIERMQFIIVHLIQIILNSND